jgi:hypothetical protein
VKQSLVILFLGCIGFTIIAQTQPAKPPVKKDSVQRDTVKNRYLPTGIRIGTDAIALIKSQTQSNYSGWEVNADVDFNRFYLAYDRGTWSRNFHSDSTQYSNSGNYWRLGADVNFLLKDPDRNMFFVGFRYGKSTFSENMSIENYDKTWGKSVQNYVNQNASAKWKEITTGLRVKMWKFIWMGYTARFKFGMKPSGNLVMLPTDVPGYGRTNKETAWGFNYQIFFRIPFRKMPPLPPAKKKS